MEKNKVSIIVPVYNGEKYIKKCIESIIEQTYRNFELIIVDDGSTDNTSKEVKTIEDSRIKFFRRKNSGVSSTRNFGLEVSSGDYVLFVDSDDYIGKNTLEFLIKKSRENDIDIIRFNGYIEDESHKFNVINFPVKDGTIYDSSKSNDVKKIISLINSSSNSLRCYTPLLFIRNENIIKFDVTLKYLEDKLFYLNNFLNNKKILFLNEKLYYYCFNGNSKTKSVNNFMNNINDIFTSYFRIDEFLNCYNNEHHNELNVSILNLILYRISFLARNSKYSFFKSQIKELNKNIFFLDLRKKTNYNKLPRVQKIKNKFIRCYLLLYLLCKIKK